MPGRATCCVPLCPNNFKNSHGLAFYRIPKAKRIRREYVRLLRSDNLNLNSDSARICSLHWDGGEKRSRTHLPSIFPWSKKKVNNEFYTGQRQLRIQEPGKEQLTFLVPKWTLRLTQWMKCQLSRLMRTLKATMFHRLFPFVILRRKLNEITGEFLNRLEFELKSTGEVKDKLAKEKDELTRDSKRLKHALKNPTFDISKFKEKDEDIEFYTGLLHWNALVLLNDM